MYKIISNICIICAFGLLAVTVVKPDFTNHVTDRVLGMLAQANKLAVPIVLDGKIEPLAALSSRTPKTNDENTVANTALSTNNIIDATNRERIKAGLEPLRLNIKLVASATLKTNDMIDKQYFEHISPTGDGVSDIGQKVGYNYIIMGENLALGNFMDGDDVVQAWMKSPGHRANILNPNYQEIGVYAARGTYQGREAWFAVQHFGTTRDVCPAISTGLKYSIDSINKDLKQRQAQIATEKAVLEGPDHPKGDEYKAKVTDFNNLVTEYNTALVISQEKIKTYNQQVGSFNNCLTQYQAKI